MPVRRTKKAGSNKRLKKVGRIVKSRTRRSVKNKQTNNYDLSNLMGRCMKCKKQKSMSNVKQVFMKNGRAAAKGFCPKCSTKMYRIL